MKKETSRKDNLSLNAEIIFGRVNPENVISKIYSITSVIGDILDSDLYCKISQNLMPAFTEDENRMRYHELAGMTEKDGTDVFSLLWHLGDQVLVEKDGELFCQLPYLLYWNSITSKIGQDIITCAWIAHRDLYAGRNRSLESTFSWKPIITTDDRVLNHIFEKGLAENHYHLNGSTQSFMLNWTFLMNYPAMADKLYAGESFGDNFLSPRTVYGAEETLETPNELIRIAAALRFDLFRWALIKNDGENKTDLLKNFLQTGSIYELNNYLEGYRNEYGARWAERKGQSVGLDYIISKDVYNVPLDSPFRLLTGERALLYNCFFKCFNNQMPNDIKGMFYSYLLIKSLLWREIVMANRQIGFAIFEHYQDRKDSIFENDEAYTNEALVLSAISSMGKGNVRSLEMRIIPKSEPEMIVNQVCDTNKVIEQWIDEQQVRGSFFYTLHFPKSKEERDIAIDLERSGFKSEHDQYILTKLGQMRNLKTRERTRIKTMAVDKVLETSDDCRKYVKGIDACASELYCRPEVFGTEFRYLRDRNKMTNRYNRVLSSKEQEKELGVTYHVGEDFLDIVDGLRSVDEAIDFLSLGNTDRIGHGTVLGLDCKKYYVKKNYEVTMDKQRLLDNLVWIYFKAGEWGLEYPSYARLTLKQNAYRLLDDIYGDGIENGHTEIALRKYYLSTKLRGDHPELYESGKYRFEKVTDRERFLLHCGAYEYYKNALDDGLDRLRFDEKIANLYYRYHYDPHAKLKSMEAEAFTIEEWYIDLADKLQAQMRRRVAEKGITVECNPTSNYLISPIDRYDEHPIWKLDCSGLKHHESDCQVSVCINTDDIGVFATSLENEYALLLVAERERRKVQNDCDDCQDIYEYLDRIRENGFRVSFGDKSNINIEIDNIKTDEEKIKEQQIERLLRWMKKEDLIRILKDRK